jgi:hypothetical protein
MLQSDDNIKIDIHEIGLEGMDSIAVVQERGNLGVVGNTAMTCRFHNLRGIYLRAD